MPLTALQTDVVRMLAAHRHPESHLGGGAAINRGADSPRYSADLDLFHDVAEQVSAAADADLAFLIEQGLDVEWLLRQPTHQRARVVRGSESVRLDWTYDSAFRFFPVQPDADFGYCLHPADLATNKCLALAGRAEVRDFLDILYLHDTLVSLGALCWAACGKDQGFTPWSLLEHAKRHMKFRQEDLAAEHLSKPVSLKDLKESWLKAVSQAEELFPRLPAGDVGCLFLDTAQRPCTPDPSAADFSRVTRHFGSLRGAWPKVS
jgi:hypothetical protein